MNKIIFSAVLCGLCLITLGCGGPDYQGDKRFAVSGTVTVDGQPMDYGTISFIPVNQSEDRVSGGAIIDGKFEMSERRGPMPVNTALRSAGRSQPASRSETSIRTK